MKKAEEKQELQLPEGLSESQYNAWIDKWGELIDILEIPVNTKETEVRKVVIKSPENDRKICGKAEDYIDKNMDKARSILVQNCVLFGLEEVNNNNIMFRACSEHLFGLIPSAAARVKS